MVNPFVEEIVSHVSTATDVPRDEVRALIEVPPKPEMGDYALPCFRFAKTLRKAPNQIARDLGERIRPGGRIARVRAAGPYLNFYVSQTEFVRETLSEILARGGQFGRSGVGAGKTVVIDFSSPDVSKPFTIAHIRSTAIGNSLCRLYEATGWDVIGINHLGDWGAKHGMSIAAYKRWGDDAAIRENPPYELFNLYVRYNAEMEKDPSLGNAVKYWTQKLEAGDAEALRLWNWFREETVKDFKRIYGLLDVTFAEYTGESFFHDKVGPVIDELKAGGLAVESEGALVVMLDEDDMPPAIIQTGHDTSVYFTRDLAAAIYRKKTYDFDKLIYTTDAGQSLHFRQLFKVLERMGYEWAKDCVHVPFGIISFKEGRMSSRRGNVIFLEDVLNRAIELTRGIVENKNPDLPGKDAIARDVGIGAVVYADLDSRRTRDVVFDWDEILNFNGETGPYVQYTHARYCSVLRRYGGAVPPSGADLSLLTEPETVAVVKCMERFPERIRNAAETCEPSLIAGFLIELCTEANRFYNAHRVISDDLPLTRARIALVYSITAVLAAGLHLLGLKAPEEM
ncbi:MAG: arginine--tRNA ligase [Candidatus Latescibacteria bacterium]|nr:arginine--tRNA ligase [Candidatus Latescibacterota bacterium]